MSVTITTSPVDRFVNTLVDNLRAREGLVGVLITTAWMGPESKNEAIEFMEAEEEQEWGQLGNRRRETTFTWHGFVGCTRPGSGDDTARLARARVYALFAELEAELRDDPMVHDETGAMTADRVAQVLSGNLIQGVDPDGRWCQLTFAVRAKATLPTS